MSILNSDCAVSLNNIQFTVRHLIQYIERIKLERKENNEYLEKQKMFWMSEITSFRSKINEHLNKLENNLVDQLSETIHKISRQTEKFLDALDEKKREIEELEHSVILCKERSSELSTYFEIQSFEEKLKSHEQYFISLQSDIGLQISDLNLTFNPSYMNSKSMGELLVQAKPNESVIFKKEPNNTNDISVKRETYIKVQSDKNRVITGCAILPNGQMVFLDFQNNLLILHNKDGSHDRSINLSGQPSDVAVVKNNMIAITYWSINKVILFDLDTDLEVRRIDLKGKCYSIHFTDDNLLVSFEKSKFAQILDLDGALLQTINIPIEGYAYITGIGSRLFCSIEGENKLFCFTINGDLLWTFEHGSLLNPRQLATDSDGYLYVACYNSNAIVVVSVDGKSYKALLGNEDGLKNPSAIDICKESNQLLVCNAYTGDAHLYTLLRK